MAVERDDWLLVNIYAPVDPNERLEFFSDLNHGSGTTNPSY